MFSRKCQTSPQACEDQRKGDRTHFDDEKTRWGAEKERLETDQRLHIGEIARLQAEVEDVRASVGPLASLPDASQRTLASIAGLDTVLQECVTCSEVLLSGIGEASFGVMSYSCGCTQVRTLHVNCIVSMASLKCPICGEEIVVIAPSLMAQTLVRTITVRKT